MSLHWVTEAMWKHATVLQRGLWFMPSHPPTHTSVTDPAATVPGKGRQNKNGSRNKAALTYPPRPFLCGPGPAKDFSGIF